MIRFGLAVWMVLVAFPLTPYAQMGGTPIRQGGIRDYRSDSERDRSESTRLVLEAVGARRGMRIVDVGAGIGYFTFKFAEAVGPAGRIEATDIDPAAVVAVRREAARRGLTNVVATEVEPHELGITARPVDVIIMVNSYRFDRCPERRLVHLDYLKQCYEALREGGRLVVLRDWVRSIDWKSPGGMPLKCDDASAIDVLVWALQVGFELVDLRHLYTQQSDVVGEHPGYIITLQRR